MSRGYKFWDQSSPYFVTFTTVHWIDVFTRRDYFDCIIDSFNYSIHKKGLIVYAWCIMTNHIHAIIGSKEQPIQDIVRDLKKFTSKELVRRIQSNPEESRKEWMLWMFERVGSKNSNNQRYQFWQQHNQPIELNDRNLIDQKLTYIHDNPVKAGFVDQPEDYLYSSAKSYAGMNGPISVVLIQ